MTEQPFLIDAPTVTAVRVFLERIVRLYPLNGALLFGSRARGAHEKYSDADLAVLLQAPCGNALETGVVMAAIAFDVLLETEILVSPLPIWKEEWAHPETHSNP